MTEIRAWTPLWRTVPTAGEVLPFPRAYPYPFEAMLSICSDLDETPDEQLFLETIRFLNGTKDTAMGTGLGLEIGNSMYFDMPQGHFSYWNAGESTRSAIRELMRSGHIDCLHSFGDLAASRSHAERALEELERHGCALKVWVDHAVAPSNFGSDIMRGSGDLPGSDAYHADRTFAYGIRYIWTGRVTSIVGQDVPRRFGGILDLSRPLLSAKTLVKEGVKDLLAGTVGGRYSMHFGNRLLRDVTLRDGSKAVEFIRCNPHPGGVSCCDTAEGLWQVLTPGFFDLLRKRAGICILYTHLGKIRNRKMPFRLETVTALRSLAEQAREGCILPTTTRRLLEYADSRRSCRYRAFREGEWTLIHIESGATGGRDRSNGMIPDGHTMYVEDPDRTRLFFNGVEVNPLQRNPADGTGWRSISVPWIQLGFPDV